MRPLIRLFFRTLRLVLTPVMLLSEKLTTPKAIVRTDAAQQMVAVSCQRLALYQYSACPFCIKVRKEMARLALPIEKRDAKDAQHGADLQQGGGLLKVPCLRIEDDQQTVRWMYESADITAYLRERFENVSA